MSQTTHPPPPSVRLRGVLLLALDLLLALLPLLVVVATRPRSGASLLGELGMDLGLVAIGMIAAQFVLASRWKWVERPFGLDAVLRFHRSMGVLAFFLLLAHPVVLAAGGHGWDLLYGLDMPWYIWLGRLALVLLLVHIAISIWRKAFRLTFERWRVAHDAIALTVLGLVFVHSWFAGSEDVSGWIVRTLWFVLPLAAAAVYVDARFLRPIRLRRRAYIVSGVTEEAPGVWTVELTPPAGVERFPYEPGQFQFLTLHRGGGVREGKPVPTDEEHHWTISSSPTRTGVVTSTIKDSGDFTSTIGRTRMGDTATVEAPFGRFSYVLHDTPEELVFVVGGIGITPPMAMIRHLRDRGDTRRVLLLYGNRTEEDIVFRRELDEIAAGEAPRLKVVHVLSRPGEGWEGETGRIDVDRIKQHCLTFFDGGLPGRTFLVCGPAALLKSTIEGLKARGVSRNDILAEAYSLAGGSMPRDGRRMRFRAARLTVAALIFAAIAAAALLRSGGGGDDGGHSHEHGHSRATEAPQDSSSPTIFTRPGGVRPDLPRSRPA